MTKLWSTFSTSQFSVMEISEDADSPRLINMIDLPGATTHTQQCQLEAFTLYTVRVSVYSGTTQLSTGADTFRTGKLLINTTKY